MLGYIAERHFSGTDPTRPSHHRVGATDFSTIDISPAARNKSAAITRTTGAARRRRLCEPARRLALARKARQHLRQKNAEEKPGMGIKNIGQQGIVFAVFTALFAIFAL